MFAVIKTGGKQYRVAADETITVMNLAGEPGDKVTFDDVLMLVDGDKPPSARRSSRALGHAARSSSRRAARRSSPSRSAAARTRSASAATVRI